jgi:hypothetical protein
LADSSGDEVNRVKLYNDLGGLLLATGRQAEAVTQMRRAYEAAKAIGYRLPTCYIASNAADIYRERGELGEAVACASHALTLAVELHDVMTIIVMGKATALIVRDQGALQDAERLLDLAVAAARSTDNRRCLAEALLERAAVAVDRGQHVAGLRMAAEAAAVARGVAYREIVLESLVLRARCGAVDAGDADTLRASARDRTTSRANRAAALYAMWLSDPTHDVQHEAAALFAAEHAGNGSVVAARRYAELTDEHLPDPVPLPPIVDDIAPADVPVDRLLSAAELAMLGLVPRDMQPSPIASREVG